MKLPLKHIPELLKKEIKLGDKVIDLMKQLHEVNCKWIKGSEIATQLNISTQDLRKIIQTIRLHNDFFLPDTAFLIASTNGYAISTNKKEIEAFIQKTHIRSIRGLEQVQQAQKVIKYLRKNKGGK